MSIKDTLLQRHTDSLLDAERTFGDDAEEMKANYQRHLDVALQALSEAKPQIKLTELQLVPFRSTYAAPSNIRAVHACYWGRTHKAVSQPWDDGYMGRLPQWTVYVNTADIRYLRATPAPTACLPFLLRTLQMCVPKMHSNNKKAACKCLQAAILCQTITLPWHE